MGHIISLNDIFNMSSLQTEESHYFFFHESSQCFCGDIFHSSGQFCLQYKYFISTYQRKLMKGKDKVVSARATKAYRGWR